jgi:hypothetical protein
MPVMVVQDQEALVEAVVEQYVEVSLSPLYLLQLELELLLCCRKCSENMVGAKKIVNSSRPIEDISLLITLFSNSSLSLTGRFYE